MKKKLYDAIVLHSGGLDSSLSLFLAIKEFGNERVLSLGFSYGQKHESELNAASSLCQLFQV
jgi:7-cyano-7-deazaguanine synthase